MKQAARNGIVSIIKMNNPRLEAYKHIFPRQELGHDPCAFSLDLTHGGNGPEQAMQDAANVKRSNG